MNPTLTIADWIGDIVSRSVTAIESLLVGIIYLAVQATQVFDRTWSDLLGDLSWTTAGNQYYAILVGDQVTITDNMNTLADIGTGGTEAQVAADTAAYIASGDGAPIDVAGRAISILAGATYLEHSDLDFGTGLTITGFASVVVMRGDFSSPQTTDQVVDHFDADDGAAEVTVTNGALNIQAPANNRWVGINAQA